MRAFRLTAVASCVALCLAFVGGASGQAAPKRSLGAEIGQNAPFPPAASLCYAFLGGTRFSTWGPGDDKTPVRLLVSCGGYLGPVTAASDLTGFAVSLPHMVLALVSRDGGVRAFSLSPPYPKIPWHGPPAVNPFYNLRPTCGGILATSLRPRAEVVDGLTGRVIAAGAGPVACGEEGKVAARYVLPAGAATGGSMSIEVGGYELGNNPTTLFAVSPAGRYLAWVEYALPLGAGAGRACVNRVGDYARRRRIGFWTCTPYCEVGWGDEGGSWLNSVADDGSIVFGAASYANPCDWCSSIYYWRPTMPPRLPVLLQRSGGKPQWITLAAARGLIARYKYLMAHHKVAPKTRAVQ